MRGCLISSADVLMLRERGARESEFLLRFQQFTSPVMAKGVEDTAFYCYNRMIGLNEVGGAPGRDGISVEEFHEYCARMQATHPLTMTTLVNARHQAVRRCPRAAGGADGDSGADGNRR